MGNKYDFSGWATKANLLCSDGRVILKDAFKHHDGQTVPLVWNHDHSSPEEILGHALLENRADGVYAYCSFNDTDSAHAAKLCVQHGDINALSIYANKLKQQGNNVVHGVIREVSLVLAGANPGASIDSVMMHGEDSDEEGYIYTGLLLENVEPLFHSDTDNKEGEQKVADKSNKEKTIGDIFDELTEEQKNVVYFLLDEAKKEAKNDSDKKDQEDESEKDKKIEHADNGEKTVKEIYDEMTEEQKTVVALLIGKAVEDATGENDDETEGGSTNMKHNVFEGNDNTENTLVHFDMDEIVATARKTNGSLKDAVKDYASLQHGIEDIDILFPDAQTIEKEPGFINNNVEWVAQVMNKVHHTPFARVKTLFADITEDEARAKGYIKGNAKVEEFFSMIKRITTPTTIYKKQKIDRDDFIDITDFDVVAWLKREMRMKLEEEIARAILIGDGRNASSSDKINEQNIRPIWTDEDVYTVKQLITTTSGMKEDEKARAFIKACIRSRKNYKGSGQPDMFMSEDMLTECLLIEDANQRVIYDSVEKLATALRVKSIIPVAAMDGLKRTVGSKTHTLAGIYVNLNDYNVGADKGGAVSMFDDFDIDYNAQKYLIETRCSGALVKPYSAVALEFVSDN